MTTGKIIDHRDITEAECDDAQTPLVCPDLSFDKDWTENIENIPDPTELLESENTDMTLDDIFDLISRERI